MEGAFAARRAGRRSRGESLIELRMLAGLARSNLDSLSHFSGLCELFDMDE